MEHFSLREECFKNLLFEYVSYHNQHFLYKKSFRLHQSQHLKKFLTKDVPLSEYEADISGLLWHCLVLKQHFLLIYLVHL